MQSQNQSKRLANIINLQNKTRNLSLYHVPGAVSLSPHQGNLRQTPNLLQAYSWKLVLVLRAPSLNLVTSILHQPLPHCKQPHPHCNQPHPQCSQLHPHCSQPLSHCSQRAQPWSPAAVLISLIWRMTSLVGQGTVVWELKSLTERLGSNTQVIVINSLKIDDEV